ncbi:oxidoreductase [Vibrio viridaestus]|uniref:FAD-dependent oxidoreductase n=1 Tax=Vibrio viridaestus TaxID=2487322 RepID=A0A3N9TLQ7_9VIBR|nr:FAD-dependent oxidoreductase [Vibrio viridaestus]RQW64545.1 FAD-dependent oxidoreductase [Vibrio viridaestus]
MKFQHLVKSGKIGNLVLKNRMIMPAMETWLASVDGTITDAVVNHYSRRAEGGVGLIITEMVNPTPGCVCFPGELDLSKDAFMPGFSRLATAIHAGGAKAALQLCHGGVFARNLTSNLPAFTPSGVGTFSLEGAELKVMTKEDIEQVVDDYGRTALRAKVCGFDAVEIHAGHGYLPVEFLSGYYNRRTDEYGGSVYNRTRFCLEIIDAIQKYCGKDFPIIFKLSTEDFTPNGITLDQAVEISKYVEEAGVAAIVATGGTLESRLHDYMDVMNEGKDADGLGLSRGVSTATWIPPTYSPRAIYAENAAELKRHLNIPVVTIGAIRPEKAEEMIAAGEADFAAIGRQILADPDYPTKVKENRIEDLRQCLRCGECLGGGMKWNSLVCAVNPEVGRTYKPFMTISKAEKPKKIAVIGSGPAGMQAAINASQKGHSVVLFEKDNRLGGLMYYVGIPDFKEDYRRFTQYLINEVRKSNVDIRMNTEFTPHTADTENFDKFIVATGSEHFIPNIEGTRDYNILNPLEILDGKIPDGNEFIICGAGLVGCEVAMHLSEMGKKITMIDIVPNSSPAHLYGVDWVINSKLAEDHVQVKLSNKILKMTDKSVICKTRKENEPHNPKDVLTPYDLSKEFDGDTVEYEADGVICALGMRSVNNLITTMEECGYDYEVIGDAYKPRKILTAVHEGYHAGRRA